MIKRWYEDTKELLSPGKAIVLALALMGLLLTLKHTGLGKMMDDHLTLTTSFKLREALGQGPGLDPRIKVYAFDNPTVAGLDATDLTLMQWLRLFETMAASSPKAIIVDKYFGNPRGIEDAQVFNERMQRLSVPVIIGTHDDTVTIERRLQLDTAAAAFRLSRWIANSSDATRVRELESLSWLEPAPARLSFYGPHERVSDGFKHLGHISVTGFHRSKPLIRFDQMHAIAHVGLLIDERLSIKDGQIFAGDSKIPLSSDGQFIVNSRPESHYDAHARRLLGSVQRAEAGVSLSAIVPGDVVVILPGMFTGHRDFVETPLGRMPGGYKIVAIVNSILTGDWITPVGFSSLLLVAFGAIAGILAYLIPLRVVMTIMPAILFTGMAVALSIFVWRDVYVDWLFPSLAFAAVGGVVFAERSRQSAARARTLRDAFSGVVAPEKLSEIIKHPSLLNLEPSEQCITVVFVDIEGFSLMAERQKPKEAFLYLKERINLITDVIHEHSGIIDKTLGDGVLAFFGYNYVGSAKTPDHADRAVACAVEIQRRNLKLNLGEADKKRPIYPLRVGVNTTHAYIGEMGNDKRIDFTLIGEGVNFASRLETACASYNVMIGVDTFHQLKGVHELGVTVRERRIQIKHHEELIQAMELDPFDATPHLKLTAIQAFRDSLGIERLLPRYSVPEETIIEVISSHGHGALVDYSKHGLAVAHHDYLAKGVHMQIDLLLHDKKLDELLRQSRLLPCTCEVRWGRPLDDGRYLHGLHIKNLNDQQGELLMGFLHDRTKQVKERPFAAA